MNSYFCYEVFSPYFKKTNGVQSHDTPHLPKYMRKLVQSYNIYSNHQIFNTFFSSQWFKQLIFNYVLTLKHQFLYL